MIKHATYHSIRTLPSSARNSRSIYLRATISRLPLSPAIRR